MQQHLICPVLLRLNKILVSCGAMYIKLIRGRGNRCREQSIVLSTRHRWEIRGMSLPKSWVTAVAATPSVLISHDDTVVCVRREEGRGYERNFQHRHCLTLNTEHWFKDSRLRLQLFSTKRSVQASGHVGWECLYTCSLRGVTTSSLHPPFGTVVFPRVLIGGFGSGHQSAAFNDNIHSDHYHLRNQPSDYTGDVVFTYTCGTWLPRVSISILASWLFDDDDIIITPAQATAKFPSERRNETTGDSGRFSTTLQPCRCG